MSRLLLCTDLDRTLVPNGPQPESPAARPLFARLAAHPLVKLVYVTGRDTRRVDEALEVWGLPRPDLVIADVGTTIALPLRGRYERWADWEAALAADWAGLTAADLRGCLAGLPSLTPQDPSRQGPFKLSYETPPGPAGQESAGAVKAALAAAGVRASVVWSLDLERNLGLLDVLPGAAGKRQALEHVMSAWAYAPREVLFAGDSGNDLDLLVSLVPAVLVANARPEIRDQACARAATLGRQARLHCAAGGVLGMNGNYAAGILEGVLHFHPHWRQLLEET